MDKVDWFVVGLIAGAALMSVFLYMKGMLL